MKHTYRGRAIVLLISLVASLLCAVVTPGRAMAADCTSGFGKKVPVLFVHGFNSGPDTWSKEGPRSILSRVENVEDVTTQRFNYGPYSLRWVTNPHIGKKLATQILCLSQASRKGGGTGKVVVVAHSMGGLAVRQAMAEDSSVAKALGLVITIGTPNTGSDIDAQSIAIAKGMCALGLPAPGLNCSPELYAALQLFDSFKGLATGSHELRVLPNWPRSVPVYAIAGNITPIYPLFGRAVAGVPSGSDALVTTKSALRPVAVNGLGGTQTFSCFTGSPVVLPFVTNADCEHSALLRDDGVKNKVVRLIRGYVQATAVPSRNLPEVCNQTASYHGNGYTLHAAATVLSGTVTCPPAVALTQAFLEKTTGKGKTNIGEWTCQIVSAGFIAVCTRPAGDKVRLTGGG